jgi:beta-lactamase class A
VKESSGRATARSRSYRAQLNVHNRKQRRHIHWHRLALVIFLGFFSLAAIAGSATWLFMQMGRSWAAWLPETRATLTGTGQFESVLEKDFGPGRPLSLLYYNTLPFWASFELAKDSEQAFLANSLTSAPRLLPIMADGEDISLKSRLEALFNQYPRDRFTPHLYLYNPQNRMYVEINGYSPVPAASVIKLPILLDYLTKLDEQAIALDTPLFYTDRHRAGGAGELQYRPSGVEMNANDVAGQMIRISDNTCTNMMIDSLGGTDAVNERLAHLGLVQTRIRNWLPDLGGTNTISPYEMATVLYNLDNRQLVSDVARENGINILKSTHNRRLLVTPLPADVMVAHKTGDIGTSLGDSGIIYMPDGRKYFISIQVERPYNDYAARDMVQRASRLVYDHIAQSSVIAPATLMGMPDPTQR